MCVVRGHVACGVLVCDTAAEQPKQIVVGVGDEGFSDFLSELIQPALHRQSFSVFSNRT